MPTMLLPTWLSRNDELRSKRSDDWAQAKQSSRNTWPWWRGCFRIRRRRTVWVLLAIFIIYTLYHQLRSNIGIYNNNYGIPYGPESGPMSGKTPTQWVQYESPDGETPLLSGPIPKDGLDTTKHNYDGLAKLYRLAPTLTNLIRMRTTSQQNRHVLFMASNMKCAAVLIPIACEMARWQRSNVHFAVMGRNDISMSDLMKVNGVGEECGVFWHGLSPVAPGSFPTHAANSCLYRCTSGLVTV